jgi:hypothetical protein
MVLTSANDSTKSLFQYDRLPTPNSIRLVKIESLFKADVPAPTVDAFYGSDFRWIRCSCETFNLIDDHRPNYYGLSYTWGYPFPSSVPQPGEVDHNTEYDERNKAPIFMNDKMMFVSNNLYHALCQLQTLAADGQSSRSDDRIVLPSDDVERRIAPYNKTPLIRAAEKGYYEYVLGLLENGADVNAKDNLGQTSLHYAAENGHLDIIRLLVMAGADHTIKNTGELTALQVALYVMQARGLDRTEICQYLTDPWQHKFNSEDNSIQSQGYFWIDAICINQNDLKRRMFKFHS